MLRTARLSVLLCSAFAPLYVPFWEWEKIPRLKAKTLYASGAMQNYRKTSHIVNDIKYHVVWITKYREPMVVELPILQ
jgi:hypothetical protein